MSDTTANNANEPQTPSPLAQVFDDADIQNNLVGLFDLLLKIDRRNHPANYD